MTATLRPMNVGEILDRTLQIYRRQLLPFIAFAAFPALIVQGVSIADQYWFHLFSSATKDVTWSLGKMMIRIIFAIGYFHFSGFFGMLVSPAITKLASSAALGEKITFYQAARFLASRWGSYLWLSALKLTCQLILPELLTILIFAGTMSLFEAIGANQMLESKPGLGVMLFWMVAGFALFLWAGAFLSLALPAAALEGLGGFSSLRRSWKLSRDSRLRIAFTWVAIAIASWAITASLLALDRFVFLLLVRARHSRFIGYTIYPITDRTLIAILGAAFGPIYPIALTLFYYDQRIRKEGFDIERMMDAAGLNATTAPPAGEGRMAGGAAGEGQA